MRNTTPAETPLRAARWRRRLTLMELAKMSKTCTSQLVEYEKYDKTPSARVQERIANALKMRPDELFDPPKQASRKEPPKKTSHKEAPKQALPKETPIRHRNVASRLAKIRDIQNMPLWELAARAKCATSTITRAEQEKHVPTVATRRRIAAALNVAEEIIWPDVKRSDNKY